MRFFQSSSLLQAVLHLPFDMLHHCPQLRASIWNEATVLPRSPELRLSARIRAPARTPRLETHIRDQEYDSTGKVDSLT
jgi:hypothetical protein